jgi:hypothetical protein
MIFRTAPGVNLWVTGPTNAFKDGLQGLSATVETDWIPFPFSMSWKFTRPDHPVRFAQGEPFCLFVPVTRGLVAASEPRITSITENPELLEAWRWGTARRSLDGLLAESERDLYQRWYKNGEAPRRSTGDAPADHETNIVARPFTRGGTPG